jgi:hypothetical protein
MFGISSQLASQTISKNVVWECLTTLGRVSGDLTYDIIKRMTVEGWAVGVRVVIKRGCEGIKGLSTIISPLDIVRYFIKQTLNKASFLNITRKGERLFLVDSFQDETKKHVVLAHPEGLTCSCMKFKCLNKRMHEEAPQLVKALGQLINENGEKICVTEVYDHETGTIEEKVHLQCHHIQAVIQKIFNADTFLEYVLNWKQNIKNYRMQQRAKEQQEESDLFPSNWGDFKRRTG